MPSGQTEVSVREWANTQIGDFTVMTYNVLSDVYIKPGTYVYCPQEVRYTPTRTSHIVAEIAAYCPDIVCCQEVAEIHHVQSLSPSMSRLGYTGFHLSYKYRPDDGLSIFYDPTQWDLLKTKRYQLGDHIIEHARRMSLPTPVLNAVEVIAKLSCGLLIGKFRHKSTNRVITVGNYHATWTEYMLPILQALEVAVSKGAVKEAAGGSPFILCGDFNSESSFPPCQILSRGYLHADDPLWDALPDFRLFELPEQLGTREHQWIDAIFEVVDVKAKEQVVKKSAHSGKRANAVREETAHGAELKDFLCALNQNFLMKSAYQTVLGEEPEITNCDADTWAGYISELSVDYLWYNKDLWASNVLCTPPRESIRRHVALPSVIHPSDHVPLMASFRFRNSPQDA